MARTNKKGFTLIELLAIVMIIGILSAIALPGYQRSVERARVGEVLSLLRSMYDSCERLAMQHNFDSCAAITDADLLKFSKFDISVKGKFANGGTVIQTNNFDYYMIDSSHVFKAEPKSGTTYAGALITFNGRTFSCTNGSEGEAQKACSVWGSAAWNK